MEAVSCRRFQMTLRYLGLLRSKYINTKSNVQRPKSKVGVVSGRWSVAGGQ